MRLANLGHASFLVERGETSLLVDPLDRYAVPAPLEAVDLRTIVHSAGVLVSNADPLHANSETLARVVEGRTLIFPAAIAGNLRRARALAANAIVLEPMVPRDLGGLTLLALPGSGDALSSVVLRSDTDALWLLGPQDVDRNRARDLAGFLGSRKRLAVVSADLGHLLRVACGGARGFPTDALAARVRGISALASSGFRVALVGGVGFAARRSERLGPLAAEQRHLVQPIGRERLARELGGAVAVLKVGQFVGVDLVPDSKPALGVRLLDGDCTFDPSLGTPAIAACGEPVAELEAVLAARLASLRDDEMTLGYHASLVEWGVRVELREHSTRGVRRLVAEPSAGAGEAAFIATEPPTTGTIVIAASAGAFRQLLAGTLSAAELALRGELRVSERVTGVKRGVRRPSWVGAVQPGPTDKISALGHVLSPLAIAELLAPGASPPEWPDRWPGERRGLE